MNQSYRIERSGSVVECLFPDRGVVSFHCLLEQDTLILAYWFNPGRPFVAHMSRDMRFPTMWYVRPARLRPACAYAQSD